jgi:ATP-binding cassette, subfamily B, bacterial
VPRKTYIDPRDLPAVDRVTLRRILSYLRPYRRHGTLTAAVVLVAAVIGLVPPLLVKQAIDRAIPQGDLGTLWLLCAGMVLAPLIAGLLGVARKYVTALVGERVVLDMRLQLYRHLHQQPLGYFTSAKPGQALSHVLNDVKGVGSVVSSTLVSVFESAVVLTTTTVLVFWLDWRLALASLALLPLFVAPTRRVGQRRKQLKRASQAHMAQLTGILSETLSVAGALHLKVYGTEDVEARRVGRKLEEILRLSLQQTLAGRWFQMLLGLFEAAGPAMVFALGGFLVVRGDAELGTLVAFVMLLRRLYSPVTKLASAHTDLIMSYAYFERIFGMLDTTSPIADAPDAIDLPRCAGAVSLEAVSFSYGEDDRTLRGIDLDIEPGQCVAVIGASGSGKSTLAALVPRLYDATAGRILIDGHDVRALRLRSLRAHIGVVTQETFLFHASVLENLRYARPDATEEEVVAAARAAQIHDYIAGLPAGYDTLVGDRGYRLSGGERQRVAIARMVLKNPRILILDEATSALDSGNEALVLRALEPLMVGRTTLVISHRPSAIRAADVIVRLEKGRIVARGDYDEMVALGWIDDAAAGALRAI